MHAAHTYLILMTVYEDCVIVSILQMKNVRFREVK